MHLQAATLVSLLGKTVESVVEGEVALILHFSVEETLTVLTDDQPYECFTVSSPKVWLWSEIPGRNRGKDHNRRIGLVGRRVDS